jgi:ketosteroid isomerase-like protein
MKRICFLLLLSALNVELVGQENNPTEADFVKMDEEWNQALLAHNLKYWMGALSTDFVFVDEKARIWDFTSYFTYASITFFSSVEHIDRSIHLHGDFAVLVGFRKETFRQPAPDEGPDQSRRVSYTKVFKKEERGWRVVAYHETRYAPL